MADERKKAVLVVSFGTSFDETRKKTIDRIEDDIRDALPDFRVYRAWTSGVIIKKLKKRDGIVTDTVPEALSRMLSEGVRDLVVQPTHILNGIENDLMKEAVMQRAGEFESISFGTPLLTSTEDTFDVVRAVMDELDTPGEGEALVFMGHGTEHYANFVYAALDYTFKDMGYENVFIGTVEGYPGLSNVMRLLEKRRIKKVTLAPFMVVAGDHAVNDMSGGGPDSWKSLLEAGGYEVSCRLRGLGEYAGVRKMYVGHARGAAL